jgi:peptide/nickel transport system substrate-binding protein
MFGDKSLRPSVALVLISILLFTSVMSCGPTAAPTAPPEPTSVPVVATEAPKATTPPEATATQEPEPTQAPEPTATQVAAAETRIVIAIPEDPPNFNASVADTGYDALVMELVMLGLADIDPEGNVFPELAAELPTVENGGVIIDEDAWSMDVTWKLRDDVTWADGKPVTADDVIFTYEAIVNPETGLWVPGIDYVDAVEKIDDYSFIIHYNSVYPGYLTQFGGEQLVVWPAHYCNAEEGFTAWECAREPLSNGPYILEDWQVGDHMTFVRNPDYYEKGKPGIDQIVIRIVPDPSVAKTMLIQGDADLYMWAPEPMIDDLKDVSSVKVSMSPTSRWVMRLFPNEAAKGSIDPEASPHPILSDVRVRRAIRMAIDVDTISQEIFRGYGVPVWTEFFRPPYVCDIPRPTYDPDGAAKLLEEAGWIDQDGDGVRECHGCLNAEEGYVMSMELMTYAEYGEALELAQQLMGEMLGKIGMKLDLSVVEGSVMWADYQSGGIEQQGNFDLNLWDDGYAGIDPTDFLWELYYSEAAQPDSGWNVVRWINPDFDALLDEAYTLDEEYRQDLFCQMAQLLEEQLPVILLFSTTNADAYSARIEGVQSTVNDIVTWNVADWKITE